MAGALLGPPWQRRENALVATGGGESEGGGLYYEPHGEWGSDLALSAVASDVGVMIAPPVAQKVGPFFELVHGVRALRRAAELLTPRTAVALLNGDNDASGISAPLVYEEGSMEEAEREVRALGVQLIVPTTGVSVDL